MKRICTYVSLCLFFACSNQGKMGKMKYGKDGAITGGSGITKCTPPSQRYAKSLDAVVKASIDSVAAFPSGSIELSLKKAVTRLSDYSSEGLDMNLILFRICEMANNRGLSANQVEILNKSAIEAWAKSKTANTNSYSNYGPVTNYGSGMAAGVVVFPGGKKVPVEDNFQILKSDLFSQSGKLGYEFRPKQGTWQSPFIAYPLDEDSVVKGRLVSKLGAFQTASSEREFNDPISNKPKIFRVETIMGEQSTPQSGSIFQCETRPSVILFGDIVDPAGYHIFIFVKSQ